MRDIESLRDETLLFNNFLADKLIFSREDILKVNKLIDEAYQQKNIKVLKSGHSEINMFFKEMPLEMQLELKKLFNEKLNVDLDIFQKQFDKTIQKVIKRGKINNEDEYRLLLDRMDDTNIIKSNDEINKINSLLINYQKR